MVSTRENFSVSTVAFYEETGNILSPSGFVVGKEKLCILNVKLSRLVRGKFEIQISYFPLPNLI